MVVATKDESLREVQEALYQFSVTGTGKASSKRQDIVHVAGTE